MVAMAELEIAQHAYEVMKVRVAELEARLRKTMKNPTSSGIWIKPDVFRQLVRDSIFTEDCYHTSTRVPMVLAHAWQTDVLFGGWRRVPRLTELKAYFAKAGDLTKWSQIKYPRFDVATVVALSDAVEPYVENMEFLKTFENLATHAVSNNTEVFVTANDFYRLETIRTREY